MRYLFFTLLGFFGPALLMFLLRLIWLQLRFQLLKKASRAEIIDVTPIDSHKPGRLFLFIWIAISLICTGLLIWQMDNTPAAKQTYIPAHIDARGNFVPAQTLPADNQNKSHE